VIPLVPSAIIFDLHIGEPHRFPTEDMVLVATDAELTPSSCDVVGRQGSAGFARTVCPVFGEFDGDVLVTVSCGKTGKLLQRTVLGEMAADVVAEAIVQGVLHAEGVAPHPAARDVLGSV
jgi:L-aminopeptidase/D-esterase-like protein